jgi:hypothetical protein
MIAVLAAGGLLASLLGYALAWSRVAGCPFAISLISTCCCIICLLFIGALAGALHLAHLLIYWGGVGALVAWWARAPRAEIRATILQPAPLIFLVGFVGFLALTRGMLLIYWDEFALWAPISKFLLLTDRLPTAQGAVLYPDYPPGDALFQYFTTRSLGFSEGNLIFAHAIFQIAALLPVLSALRWRDGALVAPLIAIGWVAGYFFGETSLTNWTSIIVDNEVAFLFAAAFAVYLLAGCGTRAIVSAIPVAVALTLIKQVGLLFALMFVLLVLVDKLVMASWNGLSTLRLRAGEAAACVLLVAGPLAANLSWRTHLQLIGAGSAYQTSWQDLYDRIASANFAETAATIVSKVAALIEGDVAISAGGLTLPMWLSALAVLALASAVGQGNAQRRLRISAVHMLMLGFLILYLAFLLVIYIFVFLPYGALQLQSFDRYLGTFLVAWMGVGLSSLVWTSDAKSRRSFVAPLLVLVACGAVYVTRDQAALSLRGGPRGDPMSMGLLDMRRSVKARLGSFEGGIPAGSRVYSVWNGTTGLPFYMSVLELKPRATNASCFSVGKARFEGDVWSCDWSSARFRDTLRSYDFLLVGQADDNFWDRYEELFAPGARQSGAAFFAVDNSRPHALLSPIRVPAAVSSQ